MSQNPMAAPSRGSPHSFPQGSPSTELLLPRQGTKVVIVALGTGGDIHPFIAIGAELRKNGAQVIMLANEHFQKRIEEADINFRSIGTKEQYGSFVTDSSLFDTKAGPMFVLRNLILPNMPRILSEMQALFSEYKPDLIVRHTAAFGVESLASKYNIPCAVGSLWPMFFLSKTDKTVLPNLPYEQIPRQVVNCLRLIARYKLRAEVDPSVNEIRKQFGLGVRSDNLRNEWIGTESSRNLGLWSPHFRPAQPDDPKHSIITGFARHDKASDQTQAPDAVKKFLDEGEAPLVFSLGTGVPHKSPHIYEIAGQVCAQLGYRGLLITGEQRYAPPPHKLPDNVLAVPYAPFSEVLPRTAGAVTHGGVGTTAEVMSAGIPHLIIPHAHDQFDNAARTKRLGLGAAHSVKDLTPESLADALHLLLADPEIGQRAKSMSTLINAEHGPTEVVRQLGKILS